MASDLHMTRRQMLAAMDGDEFAHWIAVYRLRHREQQRAQSRARSRR